MKVRQDAWSHEDDLLLAETVLRYIREGSTQLAAFEEVGDKLNRTSAACGFRWNAEVRKKYNDAIAQAKKQRKERKRLLEYKVKADSKGEQSSKNEESAPEVLTEKSTASSTASLQSIGLNEVIQFLCEMRSKQSHVTELAQQNKTLRKENEELAAQNRQLELKHTHLQEQQAVIEEDYKTLLQIMQRAKQMVSLEEDKPFTLPFSSEANENVQLFQT